MNNLEECVKKTETKKINGDEWLILNKPCNNCAYLGEVKIYYCRNRQIYIKKYEHKDQLKLPYKEDITAIK